MNDIDWTSLFLLAVAVVIFLRLRNVLGRRTGNERPRPETYPLNDGISRRDSDNVVSMPRSQGRSPAETIPERNLDERLGAVPADSKARQPLREIAAADTSFDAAQFLNGAKYAYEMIVTAYAHGDRETLENLLSTEVYDSFNAVISERESRSETTDFSFVGLSSAEIIDAHLNGNLANIVVRFVSQLVTAVRDRSGEVVEGDVKAVRQVTDVWTFQRDVKSLNPNWRLVATDAPD